MSKFDWVVIMNKFLRKAHVCGEHGDKEGTSGP